MKSTVVSIQFPRFTTILSLFYGLRSSPGLALGQYTIMRSTDVGETDSARIRRVESGFMRQYLFVCPKLLNEDPLPQFACNTDVKRMASTGYDVCAVNSFVHTASRSGEDTIAGTPEEQPQVLRLRCAPLRMTGLLGNLCPQTQASPSAAVYP